MLRWDPRLIVSFRTGCDSRTVSTDDGDLVGGVDLLAAAGRLLGAFAALAAAALLWEERGDPGCVDEVAGSAESGGEEKVEKNAVNFVS